MRQGASARVPLVTVGVFGYNHERFIAEALASVLDSTYANIEIWAVDDGSPDGTAKAIRRFLEQRPDPRVSLLCDGQNRGLAARINHVVGRARGQWLAILGGDDAYLPTGLQTLVEAIEPRADVIWGDLEVMNESGAPLGYSRPRDTWQRAAARRFFDVGHPVAEIFRYNNFVSGTSPLVRISAVQAVGGYREGARNEDLDMWLRLGPDHGFKYVGTSVARYRVVPGSNSRSEAAAVHDQAELVARLRGIGGYSEKGLARLLAMRWALTVGRARGHPPVSLEDLAGASGIAVSQLRREVPRAALDPMAGSVVAGFRRLVHGSGRQGSSQ